MGTIHILQLAECSSCCIDLILVSALRPDLTFISKIRNPAAGDKPHVARLYLRRKWFCPYSFAARDLVGMDTVAGKIADGVLR